MVNEEKVSELIDLFIPATTETPEIRCEKEKGRVTLVGNLIPSDPQSFFAPIQRWLNMYVEGYSPASITIEFYLTFINGSSARHLVKILKYLEEVHAKGLPVKIICHYENDDVDMKEWGKDLSMALCYPVELVEIN